MEITINIIPDYKKEEIVQANRLKTVLKLGISLFFVGLLFFTFLIALNKVLEINLGVTDASQETDSNRKQYEAIKKYDEEFGRINQEVNNVIKLKKDQLYWSNLFLKLSNNASSGIEITNVATRDFGVFISGKADDRDNLIEYRSKLEKEGCLSDINLPLSNMVSKNNIAFQMDLKIKEECLKNK